MLKNINSKNYFEIVKESKDNFLKDEDFVRVMHSLKNNLYYIDELGFLEECKNKIAHLIKVSNDENIILDSENIQDFTQNSDIIEIVKYFDSNAACIVVEPNKNMYLDVHFTKVYNDLSKSISGDSRYSLLLHSRVQKFAVVDIKSKLSKSAYSFKDEILKDCDFQKNEIMFNYCCEALHSLGTSITIYK